MANTITNPKTPPSLRVGHIKLLAQPVSLAVLNYVKTTNRQNVPSSLIWSDFHVVDVHS